MYSGEYPGRSEAIKRERSIKRKKSRKYLEWLQKHRQLYKKIPAENNRDLLIIDF